MMDIMEVFPLNIMTENIAEEKTGRSLAIAYVPNQKFEELYESDVGFERGTIYKELDLPFIGEEAISNE